MKKLFTTLALVLFTAACAQNDSMQGGMMEGMQCKCCQEMMKEGKGCCCMGMMSDSDMIMNMDKKDGKMQCPMMNKDKTSKESPVSKPASKAAPNEHEQHH